MKTKIILISFLLISGSLFADGGKDEKNSSKEITIENNFEYLKFDVNDFIKNDRIKELPDNTLNYLKFDVKKFEAVSDTTELPEKQK